MLYCDSLSSRTTSKAIFNILNNFITKNEIEGLKCVGIYTDGAHAMCGTRSGLIALIKDVAPRVIWNNCCIHRQSLASKNMLTDLKKKH